jgi:hypothetical protein
MTVLPLRARTLTDKLRALRTAAKGRTFGTLDRAKREQILHGYLLCLEDIERLSERASRHE